MNGKIIEIDIIAIINEKTWLTENKSSWMMRCNCKNALQLHKMHMKKIARKMLKTKSFSLGNFAGKVKDKIFACWGADKNVGKAK